MAAKKSPLSGYNHNLKYKNRVYHVQTEDSGRDNPHIFTHLFHDGTILNSSRSEYADIVGESDWETQLRARMQNQHKDMMKGLIKGTFDEKIVGFFGLLEAEVAEELPMATLPPPPKRDRASSREAAAAQTPPPAERPASQAPWQPPAPQQAPAQNPASGVMAMPMVMVGESQPPAAQPPAAQAPAAQPPAAQPPVAQAPPPPTQPPPSDLGAVFSAIPAEAKNVPDSIFGSELISEKSLDEVILAYLSEDMSEE